MSSDKCTYTLPHSAHTHSYPHTGREPGTEGLMPRSLQTFAQTQTHLPLASIWIIFSPNDCHSHNYNNYSSSNTILNGLRLFLLRMLMCSGWGERRSCSDPAGYEATVGHSERISQRGA